MAIFIFQSKGYTTIWVWFGLVPWMWGGDNYVFSVTYNVNAKFSFILHLDKDWKNREYRD